MDGPDVVLIDMLDVQSVLWLNNIELLYFYLLKHSSHGFANI